MKNIQFVTGNKRKLNDATLALKPFNIQVTQLELNIDEIQSHLPTDISEHKARQAYAASSQPLLVNDAYWSMPSLNGFPGAYLKDIVAWFTAEDFIALIREKKDKSVCITETITYVDSRQIRVFKSEIWGRIVTEPRGDGNSIETIAEFNGHTLAEAHTQGITVGNTEETVWHKFGQWYSEEDNTIA